tara:strand:+ start:323 stop:445 length:123 start_codon:yes stop_codon:yes gene_type:complete
MLELQLQFLQLQMQDMSLTDGWEVILIIVDVPLPYIAAQP